MTAPSPKVEYTHEVRFAVVMYGGVSLAIYINGIARTLKVGPGRRPSTPPRTSRLSPATPADSASADTGPRLSPTERVYRKLSYFSAHALLALIGSAQDILRSLWPDNRQPPSANLDNPQSSAIVWMVREPITKSSVGLCAKIFAFVRAMLGIAVCGRSVVRERGRESFLRLERGNP